MTLLLSLLVTQSWAVEVQHRPSPALSISAVTGASTFVRGAPLTVSANFTGPQCVLKDENTPCDSCMVEQTCPTAPACACSPRRVGAQTILRLLLKAPKGTSHAHAVMTTEDGQVMPLRSPLNFGRFVDVRWSDVCVRLGGDEDCTGIVTARSRLFRVGIDLDGSGMLEAGEPATTVLLRVASVPPDLFDVANAINKEGFLDFQLWPVKKGVAFEGHLASPAFPLLSFGTRVRAIRMFVSETSLAEAVPQRATKVIDVPVYYNWRDVFRARFTGLRPGVLQFVRLALYDDAGNLLLHYPGMTTGYPECEAGANATCRFAVTPN